MLDPRQRAEVPAKLLEAGGLRDAVARQVAAETGVPEAQVYGVGSFFHLLSQPGVNVRVCQGVSCKLAGAEDLLSQAKASGLAVAGCSCLAACDQAPAALRTRRVLPRLTSQHIDRAAGDWQALVTTEGDTWEGVIGPAGADPENLAIDLSAERDHAGAAFARAQEMGPEAVLDAIDSSGLQGRGGAGFPAAFKWKAVRSQADPVHYVVLNADEGEPGTFKDREVLMRRPDLVLEGLAIAAWVVGARDVYCYLRGEFELPWQELEQAIGRFAAADTFPGIHFHMHAGHGAYICGEETALIEALEGNRGMPRLRPPYPTESGLWGKPTLVHNVETIACVPSVVRRGGAWFKGLGRGAPGTKLYCVSGHVERPGTYELPLGVSLDELVAAAGGYVGKLKAFSPGGASSGFLPASERRRPLEFKALAEVGSMLGSAGVVVFNDTVEMPWAAREQLSFFEVESCGQCAPCRIGTRFLHQAVQRFLACGVDTDDAKESLSQVAEVAWELNEGSICGLGQAACLPLTSALRWFPEEFGV